ncbi:MAG: hypothetical protein ABL309_08185 [Phycisphaerales bacterium]
MKLLWYSIAQYASDDYLQREDIARWEIWMGRYIFVVAIAALIAELINLPLVALLIFLAMLAVAIAIVMLHSLLFFILNGDPFWIAVWYVLKYTGVFWLYWKLIFERQVQTEVDDLAGFDEQERFTHSGKDWVWLTSGPPKHQQAIVMVEPGDDVAGSESEPGVSTSNADQTP